MNTLILFFLTSLGVLFQAGYQLQQKHLYNTKSVSVRQTLMAQNLGAMLILGAICLFIGNTSHWTSLLPSNPLWFWSAVAATTGASVYIQWANAKSRSLADVSLTTPISALTPGLVTITAFLLGETPSVVGWVGIITVAVGTYWFGLGERAHSTKDLFRPFILLWLPSNYNSLTSEEKQKARNETYALRLAYGVAVVGTFGLIADALVVRSGNIALGFLVYSLVLVMIFRNLSQEEDMPVTNRNLKQLAVLAFFWTMHILVIFSMYAYAHIAYVGTLKRLSIVFVALGGYFLLQELNAKRRLVPILIITIGAILLGLDGSMTHIIAKMAP